MLAKLRCIRMLEVSVCSTSYIPLRVLRAVLSFEQVTAKLAITSARRIKLILHEWKRNIVCLTFPSLPAAKSRGIYLILDKWARPAEHLVPLMFLSHRSRAVRWHWLFLFRNIELILLQWMLRRNIVLVISLSPFVGRLRLFCDVVELMRAEWRTKYLRSVYGRTLDFSPSRIWLICLLLVDWENVLCHFALIDQRSNFMQV